MYIPTFNMSFYMSNLNMYTIDAVRSGLRTATTRCYYNEISKMKSLSHGQPVRFIRIDKYSKEVVDSLIAFATSHACYTNDVCHELPPYHSLIDNDDYIRQWCELEGLDEAFANAYFTSNNDKELWQFTYSLYPPSYNYSPDKTTGVINISQPGLDNNKQYLLEVDYLDHTGNQRVWFKQVEGSKLVENAN